MTMQEKIIQLAQTQQEIETNEAMIEQLETQIGFYRERLKKAKTRLREQHATFLEPEPMTPGMTLPFDHTALSELATNGRM